MFAATLAILITLIFYILSPVFALIVLIFFLKNKIIETVVKRWKGVSSMLPFSSEGQLMVAKTVIYLEAKVTGNLNVVEVREKFRCQVLTKEDSSGRLIYRNLQERIQWVVGYPFWTRDENFSLENHFDSYPSPTESVTSAELDSVRKQLLAREFDPSKQSPWQLTAINVKENGRTFTIIFFRIHHLLGDGHALFYLLTQLIDEGVTLLKSNRVDTKINPCAAIWAHLNAPYYLAKGALKVSIDTCPWPQKPTYSRLTAISNHISLAEVKAAGKGPNVGVTTVLMAGIAKGLQVAPKRLFTLDNADFVPTVLMIRLPHKKAHKLDSPVNPFSLVKVPLRVQDSKKCLQATNTAISTAVKTGLFSASFMRMLGGSVNILRPQVKANVNDVVVISNFPGPLAQVSAQGYPVEEIDFGFQIDGVMPVLLFSVLSYNGFLRIRINADRCIVSTEEEAQGIVLEIENQIRLFKESGNDSIV